MLSWLKGKESNKDKNKESDKKLEQKSISCLMFGIGEGQAEKELVEALLKPGAASSLSTMGIAMSRDEVNVGSKSYAITLSVTAVTKNIVSRKDVARGVLRGANILLFCPNKVEDLKTFHTASREALAALPDTRVMFVARDGEMFNKMVEYMNQNAQEVSNGQILLHLPTMDRQLALETIPKQMEHPVTLTPKDLKDAAQAIAPELDRIFTDIRFPKVLQTLTLEYVDAIPMTSMMLDQLKKEKLDKTVESTPTKGPSGGK